MSALLGHLLPDDVRIAGPVTETWQALWPAAEVEERVRARAHEEWAEIQRWESENYPGRVWVVLRRERR